MKNYTKQVECMHERAARSVFRYLVWERAGPSAIVCQASERIRFDGTFCFGNEIGVFLTDLH